MLDDIQKVSEELGEIVKMFEDGSKVVATKPLPDALKYLKLVRDSHAQFDAVAGQIKKVLDALRQITIPEMFKESGVTSLSVDGYRYTISVNIRANIRPDKRDEAFQWLRENELGALIIETVNASTLSSQARALIEEGKELEPDYFNTAHMPTTSITKV